MPRPLWIALSALLVWQAGACAQGVAAEPAKYFRQSIAPILARRCIGCHGATDPKGGLSLVTQKGVTAGGESGPVVVAGKPDESLLLRYVSGEKPAMPKDAEPLAAAEIAALREWIAAGAVWPDGLTISRAMAGADWWSLKPVANVAPPALDSPWIRTPIDAFILEKLTEHKLRPAPEADRCTLIRRLSFDLTGLPPAPEEVDAFVLDNRPDAYELLVDRLLASPRYGERWARHWLDIVHFGESHGYDKDKPRPNAWRYRDYVIAAFNGDKPYSRFVQEQLAGDVLFPDDPQATVATGFIAAGPWDFVGHVELREGTTDKEIARSNDRDDMLMTTMSTFVSLTVHCARCHDHKFDPIPQQDYYRLQAVFAGVERGDRPFEKNAERTRQRETLAAERAKLADEVAKATAANQALPAEAKEQLAALDARLASLADPQVYAARPIPPRPIHRLARGDVKSPQELTLPGALECVSVLSHEFELKDAQDEGARRAALANWIVDRANPLARRSIVNRVWQYHFGAGLVDTPNDFGRMGSLPTHPALLDWLAAEFERQGESLKKLHRLIVTSSVYRQSSTGDAAQAQADAGNRFLWRFNRRRLDAESIRDAALAASGKLDLTIGGPSARQFFFKDDHSPNYDYARFDVDAAEAYRRGVYRFIVRSVPDPLMECLDCPDPSLLAPKRNTTLTALQALSLWNNALFVRQAEHLAARAQRAAKQLPGQIVAAHRWALARAPREDEAQWLGEYAARHGLASACRLILNCNEFVFVD
ncbi:MAG TPA: PSD1 and planctomycete cytochrome C domain-containing protein [Pirellulales bacterium]|jgi:cytochrome c553